MLRIVRALAILLGLAAAPAMAQGNWPEKPVKLVVGFTAGSATDVTARLFAQKFQEAWGQPVVVENIAGNSGAIGTDRVAKSAFTLDFDQHLLTCPNSVQMAFTPGGKVQFPA